MEKTFLFTSHQPDKGLPNMWTNSSGKMQRKLGKLDKLSRAPDTDPRKVLERGGQVGSRIPRWAVSVQKIKDRNC